MSEQQTSITTFLRQLSHEVTENNAEDSPVTRSYKLAEILWQKAIGGVEFNPADGKRTERKPEPWAMKLILDRLDGRLGSNDAEKGAGTGISDRIQDTKKKTLNVIAVNSAKKKE
jgi:hypothetical protein